MTFSISLVMLQTKFLMQLKLLRNKLLLLPPKLHPEWSLTGKGRWTQSQQTTGSTFPFVPLQVSPI
jgi:hypothetical protein